MVFPIVALPDPRGPWFVQTWIYIISEIFHVNMSSSGSVVCEKIDWLIIYGFTSRSRIVHLNGDVTIAGEGLQNLGQSSALRAFEQGGIFIVPHLLWHGASIFPVSSEGPPHSVASYDTRGDVEDLI
jgi:hypothetical protein